MACRVFRRWCSRCAAGSRPLPNSAEPIRGLAENKASTGDNPSMMTVFKVLLSRRSFLFMALGAAMNAFAGYSTATGLRHS